MSYFLLMCYFSWMKYYACFKLSVNYIFLFILIECYKITKNGTTKNIKAPVIIIIGNGHRDPSSNPGHSMSHSTNNLEKGINLNYFPSFQLWIDNSADWFLLPFSKSHMLLVLGLARRVGTYVCLFTLSCFLAKFVR